MKSLHLFSAAYALKTHKYIVINYLRTVK